MRRATGLRLLVLGVVFAGIGLGIAFEPESAESTGAGAPPPLASQPPAALPPKPVDTALAESAVADFRRRTLSPEPQSQPSALIAVSGSRVGRIDSDALVVVEPGTQKKSLSVTLPGAFAVTASPGALFAVGRDRLVVLDNGERTPRIMPRPSLFPDSRLMPDLIDASRIWVHHPRSRSLFGYSLGPSTSTLLPLVDTVTLEGSDDGCFVALADGSFLHFMDAAWERLFVQGKRFEFLWSRTAARPFRALRAHRLDHVYVLSTDGELELYQLGTALLRVWHRNISPLPVDVVTSGDTVFLLRTERTQRDELNWTLQVIYRKRPDVMIQLGTSEAGAFQGDWHARLLGSFGLAASARWVSLGGTGQLRVWDAKTLEPVEVGK